VLEQLDTDEEEDVDEDDEWDTSLGKGGVPSPEEELDIVKLAHGEPRPPATTVEPRETEDGL